MLLQMKFVATGNPIIHEASPHGDGWDSIWEHRPFHDLGWCGVLSHPYPQMGTMRQEVRVIH